MCARIVSSSVVLMVLLFSSVPDALAVQKAFAYELKNDWPLDVAKGSVVVVRISPQFWETETLTRKDLKIELPFKKAKGDDSQVGPEYFVDVRDAIDKLHQSGGGFPQCSEFTLTRAFEYRSFGMHHKLPYTEIELRGEGVYLRLHFPHQSTEKEALTADFQKVTFRGTWSDFEQTQDFEKNIFAPRQEVIFTGPLSTLSDNTKRALLDMACREEKTLATTSYKSKYYFAVGLESDHNIYNANVLSSPARVAKVVNERVVPMLKRFNKPAEESSIDGIKVSVSIPFRDFANEPAPIIHEDLVDLYLPVPLCVKFANDDITSQQLLDQSVILLNSNRIQVPLATNR